MKTFKFLPIILFLIFTVYYFFPEKKLPQGVVIDKIIIKKSQHKMFVFSKGKLLKHYMVSLGRVKGRKRFEGDKKTPEGIYYITDKNPGSSFHLNLGVSYPNKNDIEYAKKQGKKAGGLIKIHGLKNGLGFIGKFHRLVDWTAGCIALTNREIEELYRATPVGTKLMITE
jgi:murein L,D-transpeptidase YafK